MKRARHEARGRVVGFDSRFNRAAWKEKFLKPIWAQCLLVFALGVLGAVPAWSQTQVTSITASPDTFNAFTGESTTFTVSATPGVTQLDVHVLTADLSRTIRTGLALVEGAAGSYSVVWNGRTDSNEIAMAGNYAVRVFNRATTTYLGPISSVTVQGICVQPDDVYADRIQYRRFHATGDAGSDGAEAALSDGRQHHRTGTGRGVISTCR